MTLDEFLENVATYDRPSDLTTKALQALWYAEKGDWQKAHLIAQDVASPDGSWVHAHLHREEGDDGNAAYWYDRANQPVNTDSLKDERHSIIGSLLKNES